MSKDDPVSSDTYSRIESNKWAKASVKTTQLKFLLDDILNKNFTEDEKQSRRYLELMETVDILFGHVLEPYHKQKEKIQKEKLILKEEELFTLKRKTSLISLRSAIIAGIGVGILKSVEFLSAFIITWISSGG